MLADKFSEVFFDHGADAVDVPGYNAHGVIGSGKWEVGEECAAGAAGDSGR